MVEQVAWVETAEQVQVVGLVHLARPVTTETDKQVVAPVVPVLEPYTFPDRYVG